MKGWRLSVYGPLLIFVALIALWYGYVKLFSVPAMILPLPHEIVEALTRFFSTGLILKHLATTAKEVVIGFLLGLCFGILLGAPIALSRTVETLLYPYVLALQTMPKVALAPLMMIWVGHGIESKIIITAIIALFPILVNVIVGLRSVDLDRINLIRSLNGGRWSEFTMVRLPSAAPFIFAGMKTAIVFSLLGAIAAEFVSAESGLGYLLAQLMFRLDTAGVFAVLLVLAAIGISLYSLADFLHRRLVFWEQGDRERLGPS
jgi:NitT/TauT family transport system permease protein